MPSFMDIFGFQPRSLVALVVLAYLWSSSQDARGFGLINFFFSPMRFASVRMLVGFPEPMLIISAFILCLTVIVLIVASTVSETCVKSLVCFPSP